jgi:hypothetical protein
VGAVRVRPHNHCANLPLQKDRGAARCAAVRVRRNYFAEI